MAFTNTTLSSAVGVDDISIVVASATGFAADSFVLVDREMMKVAQSYVSGTTIPVLRGRDGTSTRTHPVTAQVTVGSATDFAAPPRGTSEGTTNPAQPAFPLFSYSAAGAISPVQGFHVINGTSALAMTLAVPTRDQDGQILIVSSNGNAAHTLTVTGGLGGVGATADVLTWAATQKAAVMLIASNLHWSLIGAVGGAATIAGPGIA